MSEELCLVNALNQIYLCCFCINLIKYNDILAQPASDEVTLKFYVQSQFGVIVYLHSNNDCN